MNLPDLSQCAVKVEALEEDHHWEDPYYDDFAPGVREGISEMVDQHGLWGWCLVKVTVVDPTGLLSASVGLGAISCESEEDFRNGSHSDYFEDLCQDALSEIHRQIKAIVNHYS